MRQGLCAHQLIIVHFLLFRHALCVCCNTLSQKKKKKNPSGGGVSLPSDPLGLNSPQAFVCLSCSIYTLCVLRRAERCTHQPLKKHPKSTFWDGKMGKSLSLWPALTKIRDARTSHCGCAHWNQCINYSSAVILCVYGTPTTSPRQRNPLFLPHFSVIIILQPGEERNGQMWAWKRACHMCTCRMQMGELKKHQGGHW